MNKLVESLQMFLKLNPTCHRGAISCGECAVCVGNLAISEYKKTTQNPVFVKWSCGCIGIQTPEFDVMLQSCTRDINDTEYCFVICYKDRFIDKTFEPLDDKAVADMKINQLIMDGDKFRTIRRLLK